MDINLSLIKLSQNLKINKYSMASLKGIRVLEMAQIMAGPTCGLLLADLGAEVIKIEKTPGGDDTRNFLPPDVNGVSAAYLMMNRNKKGIALNLKDKEGIEIFKTMIKNSDVVLENFRKGTLEKLGIGYETMSKINPKIILCEISGYGRTGPYANKGCLLYTSPSPRDATLSRMPSSA